MTFIYRGRTTAFAKIAAFVLVLVAVTLTGCSTARIHEVNFWSNLDKKVLTVDNNEYTLRDMVMYVAYEENLVEDQANIYDSSNPLSYWNVHTNGEFVRVRARTEAMNMAISDIIFSDIGHEYGVKLSVAEDAHAGMVFSDFWDDLSEAQQELMADVYDDMKATALSMAYAQKSREIYAESIGVTVDDISVDSTIYDEIKTRYNIVVEESIWKGIGFGKVTIIR